MIIHRHLIACVKLCTCKLPTAEGFVVRFCGILGARLNAISNNQFCLSSEIYTNLSLNLHFCTQDFLDAGYIRGRWICL